MRLVRQVFLIKLDLVNKLAWTMPLDHFLPTTGELLWVVETVSLWIVDWGQLATVYHGGCGKGSPISLPARSSPVIGQYHDLTERPMTVTHPVDTVTERPGHARSRSCHYCTNLTMLSISCTLGLAHCCAQQTGMQLFGCGSTAYSVGTVYEGKGHLYTPGVRPALLATPCLTSLATPCSPC